MHENQVSSAENHQCFASAPPITGSLHPSHIKEQSYHPQLPPLTDAQEAHTGSILQVDNNQMNSQGLLKAFSRLPFDGACCSARCLVSSLQLPVQHSIGHTPPAQAMLPHRDLPPAKTVLSLQSGDNMTRRYVTNVSHGYNACHILILAGNVCLVILSKNSSGGQSTRTWRHIKRPMYTQARKKR
jgi:hypothetical protein